MHESTQRDGVAIRSSAEPGDEIRPRATSSGTDVADEWYQRQRGRPSRRRHRRRAMSKVPTLVRTLDPIRGASSPRNPTRSESHGTCGRAPPTSPEFITWCCGVRTPDLTTSICTISDAVRVALANGSRAVSHGPAQSLGSDDLAYAPPWLRVRTRAPRERSRGCPGGRSKRIAWCRAAGHDAPVSILRRAARAETTTRARSRFRALRYSASITDRVDGWQRKSERSSTHVSPRVQECRSDQCPSLSAGRPDR